MTLHEILFAFEGDLQWYFRRANAKDRDNYNGILHQVYSIRVKMLSPFAPHIAEEMWENLGYSDMVSKSSWPEISFDMNAEKNV